MKIKLLKKLREKARNMFAVFEENEISYWVTCNGVYIKGYPSKEIAISIVDMLRKEEIEFNIRQMKRTDNLKRVY